MKILIVYFSRKGYVKKIAEEIAKDCGGDLLRLETDERTQGYPGFWWCGRSGMMCSGMPLHKYDTNVSAYDKVIICSPIWVFSICAPVREFLRLESGKIKLCEYVLVHFSNPMRYTKTVKAMNSILKLKQQSYTSVRCMWGRFIKKKTIKEEF